jgi:tetratricopeptide (TPR) repeat protein
MASPVSGVSPGELEAAVAGFQSVEPIAPKGAQEAIDLAQRIIEADLGLEGIRLLDRLIAKAPLKPVFARQFNAVFDLQLRDLRRAGIARDGPSGKVHMSFQTDDGVAWLTVGRHFTRLGYFGRALEALQRAAALRPRCHATACFLGQMLVHFQRYDEADEVFSRAASQCTMLVAATRFSDSFWNGVALLDDEQPKGVNWLVRYPLRPRAVLLLSCDARYFRRYARDLVRSWRRERAVKPSRTPESSWLIHFHLVHPDTDALGQIRRWHGEGLPIAASAESPVLPPSELLDARKFRHPEAYFAAARLRVAPWLLRHYAVPVAISDLDMTLVGDPQRVLDATAQADVGVLRYRAPVKPLWEEFWTSLLVLRPTPEGRRFSVLHASYTEHFVRLGVLVWMLDQAGEYSVAAYLERHHPAARVHEMPLDFIIEGGLNSARLGPGPVFSNRAASLSFRAGGDVPDRSGKGGLPGLTELAEERARELGRAWASRNGHRVRAGPFAGMMFHDQDIGWSYLPKVLGTYAQEVHGLFLGLRQRSYARVVNVGCGDGYFAVGLARLLRLPVLAFALNEREFADCERLARINGVRDLVEIARHEPSAEDLARANAQGWFVLIALGGGASGLLAQGALARLAECDLLIEAHEWRDRDLPLTLWDRLEPTHDVQLVEPRGANYEMPCEFLDLSELDRLLAVWEMRPGPATWVWARGRGRRRDEASAVG